MWTGRKTLLVILASLLALAVVKALQRGAENLAEGQALPAARVAHGCDARYMGHCVPIASDVDCEGGDGNGPGYVSGPFLYGGNDAYGLDRDNDGIACEPR